MGESGSAYRLLVGKPEGKRPNGNTTLEGRIILKWTFSMWGVGHGLDRSGSVCERWRALMNALMNIRLL